MKTKMLFIVCFALSCCTQVCFAQKFDANRLRRAVLQSNVILAGYYEMETNYINDYSTEEYITIKSIDTTIIGTSHSFLNRKIKIPQAFNEYPIMWGDGDCICAASIEGIRDGDTYKRYSNLFFLKKIGKNYEFVGAISSLEWEEIINHYIPAILKLKELDKVKDINECYSKTVDWYIENNDYPDSYFFNFYEHKGIINDTLTLTKSQRRMVEQKILQGSEKLIPCLNDRFSPIIETYFVTKLHKIRNLSTKGYSDYYNFYNTISLKYDFSYKSVDYILLEQLLSDYIPTEDKDYIMNYFIKMFEQNK